MPQYTSLIMHSSSWQPLLITRIELEIDVVASRLSEEWEKVKKTANLLNNFISACQSEIISLSYLQDLQRFLSYLIVEVINWFEIHDEITYPIVIVPVNPNPKLKKAIECCKHSLQAIVNNALKKS